MHHSYTPSSGPLKEYTVDIGDFMIDFVLRKEIKTRLTGCKEWDEERLYYGDPPIVVEGTMFERCKHAAFPLLCRMSGSGV